MSLGGDGERGGGLWRTRKFLEQEVVAGVPVPPGPADSLTVLSDSAHRHGNPRGCYVVSSRFSSLFHVRLVPAFEDLEDLTADVAFEASLRVTVALALTGAAGDAHAARAFLSPRQASS
jgi:hypothetical protein